MIKKLKIRFVKFERALVMQILEQAGAFNDSEHVKFKTFPLIDSDYVCLHGSNKDSGFGLSTKYFNSNDERDTYLKKVTKWISEEQFTVKTELEVGEICEVSNNGEYWGYELEILAILPKQHPYRYITENVRDRTSYSGWKYARPITRRAQLAIDGDIYTWEMNIKDEE